MASTVESDTGNMLAKAWSNESKTVPWPEKDSSPCLQSHRPRDQLRPPGITVVPTNRPVPRPRTS